MKILDLACDKCFYGAMRDGALFCHFDRPIRRVAINAPCAEHTQIATVDGNRVVLRATDERPKRGRPKKK